MSVKEESKHLQKQTWTGHLLNSQQLCHGRMLQRLSVCILKVLANGKRIPHYLPFQEYWLRDPPLFAYQRSVSGRCDLHHLGATLMWCLFYVGRQTPRTAAQSAFFPPHLSLYYMFGIHLWISVCFLPLLLVSTFGTDWKKRPFHSKTFKSVDNTIIAFT